MPPPAAPRRGGPCRIGVGSNEGVGSSQTYQIARDLSRTDLPRQIKIGSHDRRSATSTGASRWRASSFLNGARFAHLMLSPAWIALIIAGLLEIAWAFMMKQSAGFTRIGWTVAMFVTMLGSFFLLARAMRDLPLGTTYAIWTGIGAVGAAIVGIIVLGEPRTPLRILCIALIIGGIAGLKVTSSA